LPEARTWQFAFSIVVLNSNCMGNTFLKILKKGKSFAEPVPRMY